ncbi:MAG TPA: right-handed parallel beta-helix repeat-containing protein [bacterium]|nr:right-handed parallel beta-helix repeat-containing protein [bacterium]
MRRISGFAFAVLMLLVFNLHAESEGYSQWLKRRDALKQDKSVVRYYTFEDVKDGKSIVADLGRNGKNLTYTPYKDPVTKEVFDDMQVIEGRWPEKKAVRLDRGFYQGETCNMENKQFSAEVWFRRQGPGSILPASKYINGSILAVSGYTQGWRILTMYEQPTTLSFEIGQPNGATIASTKTPLAENVWHHLVVTFDGTEMNIYVNGQLAERSMTMRNEKKQQVKAERFEGEYVPSKIPFKIGYSEHGVGSAKLDIDEVVIYNRALKQEEIVVSREEIFSKADAYIKQGDYKNARSQYARMKGLPGYGSEMALFNMAESYRMEKDYANAHKTYGEIFKLDNLSPYYRIYGLFRQAQVYAEQNNRAKERSLYEQVLKTQGALEHHLFTARLKNGDAYREEKKYSSAREIYSKLLVEQENSPLPHEGYRLDLRDRLEEIDGLADGVTVKNRQEKLAVWLNGPKQALYVSPEGNDGNPGTKNKPFATIKRAQEEVRKIKANGMPEEGIVLYLRGGRYYITESITLGKEDSGTESAPVVYRSYPGEEARVIGGRQVTNFKLLRNEAIISRLPVESRGKVWVADLKEAGITDYGELLNRGSHGKSNLAALELFCNGKRMQLARWPNEGHERVARLVTSEGDGVLRGQSAKTGIYQNGRFCYEGDRPERWTKEKDIWIHGYFAYEYEKTHTRIDSIDTEKKIINLGPDKRYPEGYTVRYVIRVKQNAPYYVYNALSELDSPGEWYLDRDDGKLYFYPVSDPVKSDIMVSTLNTPLVITDNASHVALSNLTLEVTRSNAINLDKGNNVLVAGCTIRNTGQWAVNIKDGWNHKIVGCDMYNMAEGGVTLGGGDRNKLIPAGHLVENNHIYSFNKFDGGYRQAVLVKGIGQRVSHNVIHDTPMQAILFDENDHVIEFNELHDVVYEGRELGAMYIYGEPWYLMSRGTVIRNNFFHHICYHSSPNLTQGLNGIHVDAINGGLVIEKNFFYRFPNGIANPQPENRIENNIFVDAEIRSIYQGDRSGLFYTPDGEPLADRISTLAARYLTRVRYKQPPWSYRYPQLFDLLYRQKPVGWAQNNFIERNINTGGPFLSLAAGIKEDNFIRNNWDGDEPFFLDRKQANFSIRPGSPVYGLTGCEPLAMEGIGVYKDSLRASWPINRTKEDIGRYYKPDWTPLKQSSSTFMAPLKRVAPPLYYTVTARKNPVRIDGKLDGDEWLGLDMKKAMAVNREHSGKDTPGAKSFAWLTYDTDNLYVGIKHQPDPYTRDMPQRLQKHVPIFEVATESQHTTASRKWWIDDMVTGPIYSITARYDGTFAVNNLFGMPHEIVSKLEKGIEYRILILDDEKKEWTAEMKIPFSLMSINPADVEQLAFNIGAWKKAGWFAWVPTGSQIFRVENAGFLKFAK